MTPSVTQWKLLGCILLMMSLIDLNHTLTQIIRAVLGKCSPFAGLISLD